MSAVSFAILRHAATAWNEQGRLQGANQSTGGIAAIIGPIFPLTFAFALRNVPGLPGLPILIAAGLLGVALVLSLRFARKEARAPLAA